ncbi:hypothetical protein FW415_10960 [Chitinophaga sp. XS-30]|nr:hypothetical protein FW415_10960 [Chitinophaga sp. XS-30]
MYVYRRLAPMLNIRNIFRNRLVIITMHLMAWLCLFLFPFFVYRIQVQDHSFYIKEAINTLFLIGIFYLNVYVLIPRFFTLKRIGIYIMCVLGLIIFIAVQQAVVEYRFMSVMIARTGTGPFPAARLAVAGRGAVFSRPADLVVAEHGMPAGRTIGFSTPAGTLLEDSLFDRHVISWRKRLFTSWRNQRPSIQGIRDSFPMAVRTIHPFEDRIFFRHFFFPEMLRKSATFALLMLFMSGFIKIALEWFKSEKQREALTVANLNAELKFLKSQINPHFLFNSLNTIYSLAHRRSPETEHALVKLSTIMRYMIYQSNEDRVMLEKELRYLQDYIDIQRLRMTRQVPVEFIVEGDAAGLEIAPMLLIPFVENAFKHGISLKDPAFINIRIAISEDGVLHLVVRNSLFKQRVSEKGGVGLTNVLKRLSLLYTDAHTITVREHGDEFIADLKIALKHDKVLSS